MTTEEIVELLQKPRSEWIKQLPYKGSIDEQVYGSMMGFLIPEFRLPWVANIFIPGHPSFIEYDRMHQAYMRVMKRLGGGEYDEDLETMKNALIDYAEILCREMFNYGRKYERMQQEKDGNP